MNPVVHFEMPANNRDRMNTFYNKAFGWKTQTLGPEMNEYVLVTTAETNENMMVKNPGEINGGFFLRSKEMPVQHTSVVIQVEDINASIKMIEDAGGEIIGKPEEIPGVGMFVYFKDTEDNIAGILQPVPPS